MRKLRISLSFLVIIVFAFVLTGCGGGNQAQEQDNQSNEQKAEEVKLQFGGIQPAEDPATQAMEKVAEIAEEKSDGTLNIEVYPASQLGDAIDQIESVSMGSQDMFVDAQSWLAQFVPDKQVESLFFCFKNEEHFKNYMNSDINQGFHEEFREKKNARVLANNWYRAPRVMVSKEPITSLEDIQGLKMRVPTIEGYLESAKALGAKPTQIPWGEVYLGLKQGVVEACEAPIDSAYSMNFYEAAPNLTMTKHIRDALVVIVNEDKYQSLSDKQKQALKEATEEAGKWYSKQINKKVENAIEKMKEDGAEFHEIDIQPLAEEMNEAAKKLEEEGMWREGLYEEIQELNNQ